MPERLGAREGTPLQVESEVRSSRETSARVEVKADGGRGDEDGSRTKTEIKTGKSELRLKISLINKLMQEKFRIEATFANMVK